MCVCVWSEKINPTKLAGNLITYRTVDDRWLGIGERVWHDNSQGLVTPDDKRSQFPGILTDCVWLKVFLCTVFGCFPLTLTHLLSSANYPILFMIIYDYTIRNFQVHKLRNRLLHRQRDLWARTWLHMYVHITIVYWWNLFGNIAIDTRIPRLFMTPWESVRPYQSDIWYVQLSQVRLYLGRVRHDIPSWLPGGDKNNANTTSASAVRVRVWIWVRIWQIPWNRWSGLCWCLSAVVKWTDGQTKAPFPGV